MSKITYDKKVTRKERRDIQDFNKGTADDWNEVKEVVNEHDDRITVIEDAPPGAGDMVLALPQTVTGAKTFENAKLLLENTAGTNFSLFTNSNTAGRIYTLPDVAGTIALTSDISAEVNDLTASVTWANVPDINITESSVTQHVGAINHDALLNFVAAEHFTQASITTVGTIGTGVWQGTAINQTYLVGQSGTNTGDQTSIVGITGTKAEYDTSVTDGDFLYVGDVTGNIPTSLSIGTVTATTFGITSDGGTDDVVLPEANTTQAGLLGSDKWDEIVANTLKVSNVSTDLSMGTVDGTQFIINSSDGNNVSLPLADTNNWGIISDEIFDNITANNAKVSNANHTGDVTGDTALTIGANKVTLGMMAQVATDTFLGRNTAATGDVEVLSNATAKSMLDLTGTNSGDQTITLTGDVTGSGTGSFAATIAADSVTMDKLADIATDTFLGRVTAATGTVEVLTNAQAKTALDLTGTNSGDQGEEDIIGTRLTDATVTGSTSIDWDAYKVFEFTLTGNTTITDSNLPTGTETKVIEMVVTGNFTLTLPTYYEALPSNDTYNGAVRNHLTISCIVGTTSSEDVIYSLQNLTT